MQLEAQLRLCQKCLWSCATGLRPLSQSYARRRTVNYYDILGVKYDASLEDIKTAFFDKSKKLHPDSDPSNPALHSQFVQLNEAYRVLSKELSRKEYDFKIQHPYTGSQAFSSTSRHRARKLEEVHSNFMDEKDRVILEIYNESKERARVNGFKKQTEILRQKQIEFQEKYKTRFSSGDK
ncbi:dnaJ homolog subfamily C member 4 isoform 2-T4 [Pholidichthys leucotaenia]